MSEQNPENAHGEMTAAKRALDDAEFLAKNNRPESAVSRAYYAIFHAARAALHQHDSNPITHRGLKIEFGRIFVKSEIIEEEYNAILQEARDKRSVADYETDEQELIPDINLARDIVAKAGKFVERIENELKKNTN